MYFGAKQFNQPLNNWKSHLRIVIYTPQLIYGCLHQLAQSEQLLPRLDDVALPRAARGAVVAEERERALYHARQAAPIVP